jgi:hypothetical protein
MLSVVIIEAVAGFGARRLFGVYATLKLHIRSGG